MKVAPVLLLSICLLISSCTGNRSKTSLQKLHLNGKVKFLAEYEYKVTQSKKSFTVDSIPSQWMRRFNNRGNWTEEDTWQPGNKSFHNVCTFDADGKPTGSVKYNADGTLCYRTVLKYDDQGNPLQQYTYDKDGKLNMRIVNLFDINGNKTEENAWWGSGALMHRYTWLYDLKGNEIAFNYFNEDSTLLMRSVYRPDSTGNVIEEHKYGNEDTTGWIIRYKYGQRDTHGNWLKKITYTEDKITAITTRKIEYY